MSARLISAAMMAALATSETTAFAQTAVIEGDFDHWSVVTYKDPMTDEVTVELQNDSLEPLQCSSRPVTLIIGCKEEFLFVGLSHPSTVHLAPNAPITIRYGDTQPLEISALATPDGGAFAIAAGNVAEEVFAGLWTIDRFAVRFSDLHEKEQTAVFDTRKLYAAARASGMSCNYPFKRE